MSRLRLTHASQTATDITRIFEEENVTTRENFMEETFTPNDEGEAEEEFIGGLLVSIPILCALSFRLTDLYIYRCHPPYRL